MKNIHSISSVIKGVRELGKWYFKGPYALTIGKPINIKGNVMDKNKVRYLSGWLGRKISSLEKESSKRLNLSK